LRKYFLEEKKEGRARSRARTAARNQKSSSSSSFSQRGVKRTASSRESAARNSSSSSSSFPQPVDELVAGSSSRVCVPGSLLNGAYNGILSEFHKSPIATKKKRKTLQ
jgi:hypothetical protein